MFAVMADLLTFSRVIAAAILVWLGLRGPQTLTIAIAVAVLAWTTDQVDGSAARRSVTPTRLAAVDFAIDVTLYAGTLAYLVLARYLPWEPVLAYVALALGVSMTWRRKAVAIVWLRLIDLMCVLIIFVHRPLIGGLLVGWVAVLGYLYRQRLHERVPVWLAELAHLAGIHWREKR